MGWLSVHRRGYAVRMSSPDSGNLPSDIHHRIAAALAAELGEPVTWSPQGYLVRGDYVSSESAVYTIARHPRLRGPLTTDDHATDFMGPAPTMADLLKEFGETHQIEVTSYCVVAIGRPTPTAQQITVGPDVPALFAKLRRERDELA